MRMGRAEKILGCVLGAIFLTCAPGILAQTAIAKASYSLLYSHTDIAEPVILKLEFTNLTNEPIELNLGWDKPDQIYFTAEGPSGEMEIHEPPPSTFDHVGRFGEVDLAPKGIYHQEIVLSQWASFDAPGDYTIELQLRGPLGLESVDSLQVQAEPIRLTVEPNAAPLVQQHCVEEWALLKGAENGGVAMDAALDLGNVKSPLAVPFMSAAIATEHATAIGGILITGLERVGNVKAVVALEGVMKAKNEQNASAAHDALTRIATGGAAPEVADEARAALDARARITPP